ncbi:MAG TPA: ketoacyl-ACP synthase III [Planctomycetota bacterium]|nr:ketoacyl-ACP synthase III [Planctomycetota bacterium]
MLHAHTGIALLGTGRFVPGAPIGNRELIARLALDTTDGWIREHIGVESRHWAPPELATSDLATEAARLALAAAGVRADELGAVVLGTSSGDHPTPGTACLVQHALGARCPAVDVAAACAGFLFALDHGARLVATGVSPVLVIGADCKSRFLDLTDRLTCSIFGDGAGAAVLGAAPDRTRGVLDSELWTDGSHARDIHVPAGGSRLPATAQTVAARLHGTRLRDARAAFGEAVALQARFARQLVARHGLKLADIAWLIPHQANRHIVAAVARELGFPDGRTLLNVDRCGNTVAAGVPMALDELLRSGRAAPGDRILLTCVGAGFTGGATLLRV